MELREVSITATGSTKLTQIKSSEPKQVIEQTNELKIDNALSEELIQNHINTLNNYLEPTQTSLKFQLHDKLNEYYVQIIDTKTDEVIKEIPSKKFLDRYAATAELLGFMVDQKI